MSSKDSPTYTQCVMHKKIPTGGVRVHTAWIPTKYATVGKVLKLRQVPQGGLDSRDQGCVVLPPTEWDDGWEVVEKGVTLPADSVLSRERDHLKQRDVSDI